VQTVRKMLVSAVVKIKEDQVFSQASQPIVIIGGLVNDAVCSYTGADYWVNSCIDGANLCMKILKKGKNIPVSG